jgi:hypothetical protein
MVRRVTLGSNGARHLSGNCGRTTIARTWDTLNAGKGAIHGAWRVVTSNSRSGCHALGTPLQSRKRDFILDGTNASA